MIFLSIKLAFDNLIKHKKIYLPFLSASAICFGFLYLILAMSQNKVLNSESRETVNMLFFGHYVELLFIGIFLFYINSFLMKRRKREFGLYEVFGLEKKHMTWILFFELLFLLLASSACGMLFGFTFYKLAMMAYARLIQSNADAAFHISVEAMIVCFTEMSIVYLLMYLYDMFSILRLNSIDVFRKDSLSAYQAKNSTIPALLGFAFLIGGYALALRSHSALEALGNYAPAILFVVIGTYLLFISGSTFILNLLSRNKHLYYRPTNFLTIAQMKSRIRDNAISLSTICILSTMVIVIVSSVFSLYLSIGHMMRDYVRNEVSVTIHAKDLAYDQDYKKEVEEKIYDLSKKPESVSSALYLYLNSDLVKVKSTQKQATELPLVVMVDPSGKLKPGEAVLLNGNGKSVRAKEIEIGNQKFKLISYDRKENRLKVPFTSEISELFVSSYSDLEKIAKVDPDSFYADRISIAYPEGTDTKAIREELEKAEKPELGIYVLTYQDYETLKKTVAADFGGILFIGVILSALFLLMTLLIMYYKQITEGYEDKKRFEILQKVGISDKEVKHVINIQVLIVFFSPLLVAAIHILFNFNILRILLSLFNFYDIGLFVLITAVTLIIYAMIYMIIYFCTSRIYYNIIKFSS